MPQERKSSEPRKTFEFEPEERLMANIFGYSIYSGSEVLLPISDSAKEVRNKTVRQLIAEARETTKSARVPGYLEIVEMRYGLAEGAEPVTLTLEEVAKRTGRTREEARLLEAKGLRVLRHPNYSGRLRLFIPYSTNSIAYQLYDVACEYDLIEAVDPDQRVDFVKATTDWLDSPLETSGSLNVTDFLKADVESVGKDELKNIALAVESVFGLVSQNEE